MSIRLAAPHDYATFARLFLELRVPDPTPSPEHFEKQMLPAVIVAEENNTVLGYAFWIEKTGHVSHVVVDEHARNRGIGRALLEVVRERMISAGHARWSLTVMKTNDAAVALYRRLGFSVAGERWLVRTTFTALAALPHSFAHPFTPEPADDAAIAERFAIDRGRIDISRAYPGRVLFGLRAPSESIAGFAAFDPHFPGFPLFHVAALEFAGPLAALARPHAKEDRVHVVAESKNLASYLRGEVLKEMFFMTGALTPHPRPPSRAP